MIEPNCLECGIDLGPAGPYTRQRKYCGDPCMHKATNRARKEGKVGPPVQIKKTRKVELIVLAEQLAAMAPDDVQLARETPCKFMDPALFTNNAEHARSVDGHEEAREACLACPSRMQCLNMATRNETWGIWAATTRLERQWLGRLVGVEPAPLLALGEEPSRDEGADVCEERVSASGVFSW